MSELFLIVQLVVTTKLLQNQTSIVAKVDPTPSNVRPDKLVLDTEVNEDTATGHKTRCNSDDDGHNANGDGGVDGIDDDSEDGD